MTGRRVLILFEELPEGGITAQRVSTPASMDDLNPIDKPIYAEEITTGAKGLTGKLHKRLVEIFKKEA